MYDWDFGSPQNLANYIRKMKNDFANAGHPDIPVSISDMAYGWQQAGDISSVADAVDFFMINNFPYFAWDARDGGSSTSWNDFTSDIKYFEGIANGKPLLVTQASFLVPWKFCIHLLTISLLDSDWLAQQRGRVFAQQRLDRCQP